MEKERSRLSERSSERVCAGQIFAAGRSCWDTVDNNIWVSELRVFVLQWCCVQSYLDPLSYVRDYRLERGPERCHRSSLLFSIRFRPTVQASPRFKWFICRGINVHDMLAGWRKAWVKKRRNADNVHVLPRRDS